MKTRKKMLRGLLMLLALFVLTTAFWGCAKKDGESKDTTSTEATDAGDKDTSKETDATTSNMVSDKPVTFSMLYSDNANYQLKEDWMILTEITKKTNVTFDIMPVPESDYKQKRQIIINSGNIPDIVTKTAAYEISEQAVNGVFLPISEYVDQMPVFSKFVADYGYEQDLDNNRESDNNYYILPVNANPDRINAHIWLMRVDLLKKHNLEVPKTMDDLLAVGKVLKEAYPDSTPITNRFLTDNIISMISEAYGVKAGWNLSNAGFMLDTEKDEWFFAPTSDDFKEMLQYMNKMMNEGVLDKEFATLDSNVYEQRVVNSTNFLLADWVGNEIRYNLEGKKSNPDFEVAPVFPPKGPKGYALGHAAKFEQSWVIPSSVKENKNFDTFIKLLDWFYTDEASLLTSFGVEGITFNFEGDKPVFIPEIKSNEIDHCKEYGIQNNALTVRNHPALFGSRKTPEIEQLYKDMDAAGCVKAPQPSIKLTVDQKEEEKMYYTALTDYHKQMTEKFIFGSESFDNWDAFVADAEEKGAKQLRKLYNDAWQAQNK